MPRPLPKFKINLQEGSVDINFSPESARELRSHINQLMERLRLVAVKPSGDVAKTKSSPQPNLEYQHTGEVFLEIFCNPNIWANPYAAKVLITLRDDRIRLTTEAELSRLIEDINQYLEQHTDF
ncbi:hypothetical protein Syn7502_00704 [Synechococcus sp. PCC 7502]|uniref:hypothetical protein n=1 Tax=Synechococcus sp. PCC 7502 TaxID=1173263 RepID=UPI00029FB496|nr:hypothetical protein [Synechococcus sp. PCC 7502]AFY72846.1 hypothetical protein Syn7502_00704 [Synechococcus sp. PCC 7502]